MTCSSNHVRWKKMDYNLAWRRGLTSVIRNSKFVQITDTVEHLKKYQTPQKTKRRKKEEENEEEKTPHLTGKNSEHKQIHTFKFTKKKYNKIKNLGKSGENLANKPHLYTT